MQIRPILFLDEFSDIDEAGLHRLGKLGLPLLWLKSGTYRSLSLEQILKAFSHSLVQYEGNNKDFHSLVRWCAGEGWTHFIAIREMSEDLLQEIESLEATLLKSPWEIIKWVSNEREQRKNSPLKQRLLDLDESDYRHLRSFNGVYPLFLIQSIDCKESGDLQSTEILVSSLWRKIKVSSKSFSYSEMKPEKSFWKSVKSHLFDWYLLSLTSLHNNNRPTHSALSFAMGIFVACSPLYGLQTGLLIFFAFVFRLSFPVAFLGSQISIPPIYSLLVPLQVYLGFLVTGEEFHFDGPLAEIAQTHGTAWALGSLMVGSLLSILGGSIWYLLQSRQNRRGATWTGKMRGGYLGNLIMKFFISKGGLPFAYFILFFVVPYFYFFAPTARNGLSEYYKLVQPKLGWFSIQVQVLRHLYRFAQTIVDQAYQANHPNLKFDITYESGNVLKQVNSDCSRILLFSHFGGWGLATQGIARRGASKPIHLLRYESKGLSPEKILGDREKKNVKTISVEPGQPIFMAIHEVLSNKGQLAVMGDRPFDNNYELKPLLGRLAPIPLTPFRVAKTYKSQLTLILSFKTGMKTYSMVTRTIEMKDTSVEEAIEQYLAFLEEYVECYPEQWFNHYKYWSLLPTRPDGVEYKPPKYTVSLNSNRAYSKNDRGGSPQL